MNDTILSNYADDFATDCGFRYSNACGGREQYLPHPVQYEASDLASIGPIVITDTGEENMYFTTADGTRGYAKCC